MPVDDHLAYSNSLLCQVELCNEHVRILHFAFCDIVIISCYLLVPILLYISHSRQAAKTGKCIGKDYHGNLFLLLCHLYDSFCYLFVYLFMYLFIWERRKERAHHANDSVRIRIDIFIVTK